MQALGLVWGEVDRGAPDYRQDFVPLAGPRHPGAQLTFEIWQARMAQGGFVVGRDIPSRALSSVLRNLAIWEPVADGCDYRVRLAGTAFYRHFGYDITGTCLSELVDPVQCERLCVGLAEMFETGRPISAEVEQMQGSRPQQRLEMLTLPVSAPGGASQWALSGMFFHDWVR